MNPATWLRLVLWFASYLVLALGSGWLGTSVVAHLQGRPYRGWLWPTLAQGRAVTRHAVTIAAALLAGSAVPLAAPLDWGSQTYRWHILGETEGGLLIALAGTWIAAGLLIASDRVGGAWSPADRQAIGPLLVCAAVSLLALPGLAIAASPLVERGSASLSTASIIASQQRWFGLGWLGITQPLSLVAWLACTFAFRPAGQNQASLAWQLVTLNWALLTTAAFLGGWQGPFAAQTAWLGYVYTAVKVALLVILRAWVSASLPVEHPVHRMRNVWALYVPILLLNLVLTAGMAVLRY